MSKESGLLDPNGEPYYSDKLLLDVIRERASEGKYEELLNLIRVIEFNANHMGRLSVQLSIKKALNI